MVIQHLIFHPVRDSKALGCVAFCKQNLRPLWQLLVISPVNSNEAVQLKTGFIYLNFIHLSARHRVYNNCAFSFPLRGARSAHLEASGCSPVLLAGGPASCTVPATLQGAKCALEWSSVGPGCGSGRK